MRLLIPLAIVAVLAPSAAAEGTACSKLVQLAMPQVAIESATPVSSSAVSQWPKGAAQIPEFCRVQAVARPTSDSEIHIEVWMPAASAWNGKFLGTGNGGYSSTLSYSQMAAALEKGYATAGHDTGHTGGDLRFGLGHPEKVQDYAWRAVHVMTTTAKHLVRVHFGKHAEHAYFAGCSAGGHQALSEVQRFPEDYDGVIAGAPANNRIRQTFGFLWFWMAMHDDTGSPLVSGDDLRMVSQAAVNKCDASDGLKDGLIADPPRCAFDPAELACPAGQQGGKCLTPRQVEAFRKVYSGLRHPETGQLIFHGFPKGSEYLGDAPPQSWRMYLLDPKEPMRAEALRYFLFHDPNWDWRTVDFARDLAMADRELGFMNATATDLSPFAKRGGKLLLYAGWADPIVPPGDTIRYYESVAAAMGGVAKTQQFARLFVAPGMAHCGGGPGPNQMDTLDALDRWVTKGEAPAKLIATHRTGGTVDRTRPVCAFPQVARHKAGTSGDKADHFVCAAPAPSRK